MMQRYAMANCELCGRIEERLLNAVVEGSMLSVCKNCARFGNVVAIKREDMRRKEKVVLKMKEENEDVVFDYAERIEEARQKLGMTQEDLAKKISEKASIIHKVESGNFKPNAVMAKKLENALKIKLIDIIPESSMKQINFKEEGLTIGDMIKVKKKK